jgi:hypothetical protein
VSDADLADRVGAAIARLEQLPEGGAKEAARDALGAVLDLHRVGLARLLERLPKVQLEVLSNEPLVASVLALHDLHPSDLKTRVQQAAAKVHPLLALNGAAASVEVEQGEVRVTLERGAGCGSTAARMRQVLEQAVQEAAPDATAIRFEERVRPA